MKIVEETPAELRHMADWFAKGAQGFGPMGVYARTARSLLELAEIRERFSNDRLKRSEPPEVEDDT